MSDTVIATATVLDRLGGRRSLVDGAVPPLVFVVVHALVGLTAQAPYALGSAVVAATSTALGIVLTRAHRGESLAGGLRGLAGLAVAIGLAAWTGHARDFFLPGIAVDAAYGVAFVLSALVGRPLAGHVYGFLFRLGGSWRDHGGLRRTLTIATWGWAAVFGIRAVVQGGLYRADQPELLALAKLTLGWPLTAAALVLTLGAARRAQTGHCRG